MKKDIFIDNNIAKNFSNPVDSEYKKLIEWLMKFNSDDIENKDNYAHLVVSNKLLKEYSASNRNAASSTNISVIINSLIAQGRLIKISNENIKDFKARYFTKTIEKRFKCNVEDQEHIPVVLLSNRKYALTYDDSFTNDLLNFPGFVVKVEKRPEHLPYED